MSKNTQRLSQLVSTFGPGSMVDLPTRSVIIGGLDLWKTTGETLSEPRLTARLEQFLKEEGRLAEGVNLSLRLPPLANEAKDDFPSGVDAPIFPTWFVCEKSESSPTGRRRRLVRWQDLDSKGRRKFEGDDGTKSDVTPIRFVGACDKGHLQDIDWRWVVHRDFACREPLWMEEKGTSADPADTSIVCTCGRRLSLREAFQEGRLGKCGAHRPWLLDKDPEGCSNILKLLTRTATNTYFPQVYTVISLPSEDDKLSGLVDTLSGDLAEVQAVEDVAPAKKFNSKIKAVLGSYSDADIFDRLQRVRQGAKPNASGSPKLAEFDLFASGRAEIGHNHPTAKLYAQTLPREVWDISDSERVSGIKALVAVHRLREVSCLYGFTRFEAAPTSADGDLEDAQLSVRGAPLSKDMDWLPAIEQFGEGLFVHFDVDRVKDWVRSDDMKPRNEKLLAGYDHWQNHWQKRFSGKAPAYPGTPYVLLHSISHALMAEIALDCGYPSSALKERVYALSDARDTSDLNRCGILLYTASAGSQGTLGGLVATASRFTTILHRSLERLRVCSNDPICADHEPNAQSGDRATHGAACHNCLLIAETSCEMRNLFLDRSLLVPTMADEPSSFFKSH